MGKYDYFELIRQSDELIYQFDYKEKSEGVFGYQRRDQDLWITYRTNLGWVAYDDATQTVMGKPWDTLPSEQDVLHPPEGIWVSRKGPKSYVYKLEYKEP